ncbi:hypothetical protein WJX72_001459 [[Myrmecia] bisecta]|uniref:Thioredoxin domain-containing protein n=1 Tax=[Myrmecia] bisecta TaxID=41462 RepID=A0AAW1P4G5_9CHLO
MDGVLCNSEEASREVGAEVMGELYGISVTADEFIPFAGTGEANFLGGVARKYGVAGFDPAAAKSRFFQIHTGKYAKPDAGIGFPGARELVAACRKAGLKVAVASSADRIKVDANLSATGFALDSFDAIVSADAFERLKPSPDIFLAAAAQLGVSPRNCVVIEDAAAGVQAARAAGMRCIAVTTTLSEGQMVGQAPDVIRRDISQIALADIQALKPLRKAPRQEAAAQGQGFLEQPVQLPNGYSTTRRELLKFVTLGAGLTSIYVALTRAKTDPAVRAVLRQYHIPVLIQLGIIVYVVYAWPYWKKAMSYASPQAVVNALLPRKGPPTAEENSRVAAFKRFIADQERRGGGEPVPEFPQGMQWYNAPPLKLNRELKGKVVVLDFWTYCCINCMHVLPELAALEAKYQGQPVAVVGVHSAKFDNEKDNEAIRNAVLRYEITHPVCNDTSMSLWRDLGIASWPTLALVSPAGRLIATLPGEGHKQDVDDLIAAALEFYGEKGLLDATPVPQTLERNKDARLATSQLRFPGKVATDLAGDRLFIADSNNNRIVITTLDGRFLDQVGGNGPALRDGSYAEAAFKRPQGLAFSPALDKLYVADTENHALRCVDLAARSVRTLAGNGQKGRDYVGGGRGPDQQLNSPWDLQLDHQESTLYIAMAGQHQVWRHDLQSGRSEVFSGDGYERNQNGRNGVSTSWAQPSGLSLAPNSQDMWVADSESSAIRSVSLANGGGQAHVGGDPYFSDNLFRFGDKDGVGTEAMLQHPLAVCATEDGLVYVADSYNHKIKVIDPSTNRITTVAGSGRAGFADGSRASAQLSEPGGLARGPNGTLLIADTNNSVIRVLDPRAAAVKTLDLRSIPPPKVSPDQAGPLPDAGAESLPEGMTLDEDVCLFEEVCFEVPFSPVGANSGGSGSTVRLEHRVSAKAPRTSLPF